MCIYIYLCVCLYGTTKVDRAENFLAMVGGDILYNVGKAIINHPFGNGNHSTYLWNLCIDGSKSYKIIIFGGINIHISSYFRVPRVAGF